MSAWQLFVSAVELGVAAAILAMLVWAAGARAGVHRHLRSWGVALGTVAGCA